MPSSESSDSSTRSDATSSGPAIGIWLLRKTTWPILESTTFYKAQILIFTYIAYAGYHLSRRPLAVIKSTLHHETCAGLDAAGKIITSENATTWCDWHRKYYNIFIFFIFSIIIKSTLYHLVADL